MHYLWLFHSRNGLICTHANERRVWIERQTGWRGKKEKRLTGSLKIKAMENTQQWGLSLSQRRQYCWSTEEYCYVYEVSPACRSPISDSKGSINEMIVSLCFLRPRHVETGSSITMHKLLKMLIWPASLAKAVFLLYIGIRLVKKIIRNFLNWRHLNVYFIPLTAEIQACKGHKCLTGRIDRVIRNYRVISTIQRLNYWSHKILNYIHCRNIFLLTGELQMKWELQQDKMSGLLFRVWHRQQAWTESHDTVCMCVDVYYTCCGDINLFIQSHCGDSPSLWGQNADPIM